MIFFLDAFMLAIKNGFCMRMGENGRNCWIKMDPLDLCQNSVFEELV